MKNMMLNRAGASLPVRACPRKRSRAKPREEVNKQRKIEQLLTETRSLSKKKRSSLLRAYFRAQENFDRLSRQFFRVKADDLPRTVQDMLHTFHVQRMQAWGFLIRGRAHVEVSKIVEFREARKTENQRLKESIDEARAQFQAVEVEIKKLVADSMAFKAGCD
jgi:hypothetical protein